MILLEVAVAAPLESTLTYIYSPDDLNEGNISTDELLGRRVIVPLSGRLITGYILGEVTADQVNFKLKKIKSIIDQGRLFHKDSVTFFRWVARYYQYPIGEVIAIALPAGLKQSTRKVIYLNTTIDLPKLNSKANGNTCPEWLHDLYSQKKLSAAATARLLSSREEKSRIKKLIDEKVIAIKSELSEEYTREKTEICYTSELQLTPPEINDESITKDNILDFQEKIKINHGEKLLFSEVKALYYFACIAENSLPVPQNEILKLYKNGRKPLQNLCKRGLLKKIQERVYRNPLGETHSPTPIPDCLNAEQQIAVEDLIKSMQVNTFSTHLLHGVTGSGKTEVYLQAAKHCLDMGKDVLVLVPEIALATQLEGHFVTRFKGKIALLHSGLSKGEKFDQWSLAAEGQVKIVIGARSAVFAPLPNIGLIIVDEEHDSGYKQDDSLRYNARDLAVLRAQQLNCCVILGSATPSITSYFHAQSGKYNLQSLHHRVGNSILPKVEIIDLRKSNRNTFKVFHESFLQELQQNLDKKEQSLVLLNRRGFSAAYLCQDCGATVQCKHCKVTLTYHKHQERLICHYCGYFLSSSLLCSSCHSEKLIPFGFGTERIAEELADFFPDAMITRLDSDTASNRKKFLTTLKAMRDGEIDILIGTQMIAKGHHFPNVTFVGVVWADGGLNMPDFRAAERTYQLLSQVTGRAGRGGKEGRVIIQTMRPHHYAIELAKSHKYHQFYLKELEIRRSPLFPPFVRLVCFKVSGVKEYNVRSTIEKIAQVCRKLKDEKGYDLQILGPASSPVEKIKDQYRWQLLLKSCNTNILQDTGRYIQNKRKELTVGRVNIGFDMDPENMM